MSQISIKDFKKIEKWLLDNGFEHVFGEYTPDTCHQNNYQFDRQYDKYMDDLNFTVFLGNTVSVSRNQNPYMQIRYYTKTSHSGMCPTLVCTFAELEEKYRTEFPGEYREVIIDNLLND